LPVFDHIGDVTEMILDSLAAVKTGRLGLADNLLEIPVIRIAEYLCKVPARPVFITRGIRPPYPLKRPALSRR
jgi:hypothetical protein